MSQNKPGTEQDTQKIFSDGLKRKFSSFFSSTRTFTVRVFKKFKVDRINNFYKW